MYILTEKTNNLLNELKPYIIRPGEFTANAPEGTKEKYAELLRLVDEEEDRQIALMCQ